MVDRKQTNYWNLGVVGSEDDAFSEVAGRSTPKIRKVGRNDRPENRLVQNLWVSPCRSYPRG